MIYLSTSDKIQLLSVCIALILGLISIINSYITLKQNKKLIVNSTRPYINISFEVLHNAGSGPYFVLKNYGASGATITNFTFSENLTNTEDKFFYKQFENINGLFLAPNQSKIFHYPVFRLNIDTAKFSFTYTDNTNVYSEHISLKTNLEAVNSGFPKSTSDTTDIYFRDIAYTLDEILKKNL